jgi:hypothetical protein
VFHCTEHHETTHFRASFGIDGRDIIVCRDTVTTLISPVSVCARMLHTWVAQGARHICHERGRESHWEFEDEPVGHLEARDFDCLVLCVRKRLEGMGVTVMEPER